jgi:hypothetical protein
MRHFATLLCLFLLTTQSRADALKFRVDAMLPAGSQCAVEVAPEFAAIEVKRGARPVVHAAVAAPPMAWTFGVERAGTSRSWRSGFERPLPIVAAPLENVLYLTTTYRCTVMRGTKRGKEVRGHTRFVVPVHEVRGSEVSACLTIQDTGRGISLDARECGR